MATYAEGPTPIQDVHCADWLLREIAPFETMTVAALLPARFTAYARVLHPAWRRVGDLMEPVRWGDVAAATGQTVDPAMDWEELVDPASAPGPWCDQEPDTGHLAPAIVQALVQSLRPHTTTPDACVFGVWDGFGYLPAHHTSGVLELRERPTWLLTGSVEAAVQSLAVPPFEQSPSMWWPEDRAWFVATEVDLLSTFVGGSVECIAAVLADPDLEAFPATADQRVDARSLRPSVTRSPSAPWSSSSRSG